MVNTLSAAKTLYNMYYDAKHVAMDEMKMHKLMYFSQREALLQFGQPLFDDDFVGWKYGPVLKSVRHEYWKERPFANTSPVSDLDAVAVLKSVYDRYADLSSWELSALSHGEYSWKRSREGLSPSDEGDVKLELNAIKVDAATEKHRRLSYS